MENRSRQGICTERQQKNIGLRPARRRFLLLAKLERRPKDPTAKKQIAPASRVAIREASTAGPSRAKMAAAASPTTGENKRRAKAKTANTVTTLRAAANSRTPANPPRRSAVAASAGQRYQPKLNCRG